MAFAAYFSATSASQHGLCPYPFLIGAVAALLGFVLSLLSVKETHHHMVHESASLPAAVVTLISGAVVFFVFKE